MCMDPIKLQAEEWTPLLLLDYDYRKSLVLCRFSPLPGSGLTSFGSNTSILSCSQYSNFPK